MTNRNTDKNNKKPRFELGDKVKSAYYDSSTGTIQGVNLLEVKKWLVLWDHPKESAWHKDEDLELAPITTGNAGQVLQWDSLFSSVWGDGVPPVVDPKKSCADKKLTFDSVPITLQILAAPANQSGADKYGAWNWLKLPDGSMSLNTYLNALQRHLILFRAGQDYTSDTHIHNLDSMIAGLAVVRDAMIFGKVCDDRIKLSDEQIKTLEALINKEQV